MDSPGGFLQKLAQAIAEFGSQLGSSRTGTLTQAWVPEPGEDGSMVLKTQGTPYSVCGAGDLLSLFRCISCKYICGTDTTRASLMGAVGRVYTSGEPEMTTALQSYDASVYLRVAEARRCQINCAMFLPVFLSPARDRVAAVLEVSQTEDGALFAALLDWARCCLGNAGLCTTDADKDSLPVGLRVLRPELELTSALESGVGGRAGGGGARLGAASDAAAGSMPPPPRQQPAAAASAPPPPALPPLQPGSSAQAMTHNVEAGQRWQGASVEWEADDAAGGGSVTAGAAQAQQPQVQRQPQQQQQQPAVQANAQPQNVAPGCIVRVGNSLVFCADAGAVGGVGPAPPAGWEGARKGTKRPAAVASLSGPASRPTSLARTGSLPSGGAPSDSGAGTSLSPSLVAQRAASGHLPAASYGHGDRVVTLDDIRPHFGSSLKAAAAAMGVCVTTLKRACRRLGLPRWPRRELAKLTRDGGAAAAASTGSGQTISAGSSGELQQRQARPGPGAPVPQAGAARAPAPHAPAHAPSQTPAPQHQTQPPTPQMLALPVASAPAILGAMDAAPLDFSLGVHSMESIDILAAADFDCSIGNSPRSAGFFGGGLDFATAAPNAMHHASAHFGGAGC